MSMLSSGFVNRADVVQYGSRRGEPQAPECWVEFTNGGFKTLRGGASSRNAAGAAQHVQHVRAGHAAAMPQKPGCWLRVGSDGLYNLSGQRIVVSEDGEATVVSGSTDAVALQGSHDHGAGGSDGGGGARGEPASAAAAIVANGTSATGSRAGVGSAGPSQSRYALSEVRARGLRVYTRVLEAHAEQRASATWLDDLHDFAATAKHVHAVLAVATRGRLRWPTWPRSGPLRWLCAFAPAVPTRVVDARLVHAYLVDRPASARPSLQEAWVVAQKALGIEVRIHRSPADMSASGLAQWAASDILADSHSCAAASGRVLQARNRCCCDLACRSSAAEAVTWPHFNIKNLLHSPHDSKVRRHEAESDARWHRAGPR